MAHQRCCRGANNTRGNSRVEGRWALLFLGARLQATASAPLQLRESPSPLSSSLSSLACHLSVWTGCFGQFVCGRYAGALWVGEAHIHSPSVTGQIGSGWGAAQIGRIVCLCTNLDRVTRKTCIIHDRGESMSVNPNKEAEQGCWGVVPGWVKEQHQVVNRGTRRSESSDKLMHGGRVCAPVGC